ncbi:MAG: protoglobin domain-containing protein [Polyangiales bacterium]
MGDRPFLAHLREYVGLDDASAACLLRVAPRLRPHFESIVTEFYDAILADPNAKAVLKDEAQVERLRVSMMDWLNTLVGGSYDEAYFQKRAKIGRVHVKVGLEQRYMLAAMNILRTGLHGALAATATKSARDFDGHRAIDQICDIELAIMLETYREDYVLKKTAEAESLAIMGRLTTGLAHEVRNPLNAAKLQLDVLQRNAEKIGDEGTRRRIDRRTNIVRDELQRLSHLLDDFLNLARSRRFEPLHCDGCELLSDIMELRQPEIQSLGVDVDFEFSEEGCGVIAEPDRLKQVINNLITNAVEAVKGVESPSIHVSGGTDGVRWRVIVRDNGPGVAPDVAPHAFDSFVTTKDAGTGLGLAIVKRIIDLHGGGVELVSNTGGGTSASFWIPLRP